MLKMSTNVLMTLPKYVPIPNKNGLPIGDDSIDSFIAASKKRRLDHLTWEEKLQRKKLKNRVAAQTSRDRKKAKMDEMDHTVKRLTDENIKLKEQFERLNADKDELMKRNIELEHTINDLRAQMSHNSPEANIKIESSYDAAPLCDRWMGCGIINNNGSAEGNPHKTTVDATSRQHLQHLYDDSTVDIDTAIDSTTSPSVAAVRIKQENRRIATNSCTTTSDNSIGRHANEPQKQYRFSCSVEDNCSMPSLQDMLEEFDASRLEELAESLLADVAPEFEDDAAKGRHRIAQTEGKSKSMLRPMVGPEAEELESSKDIDGGISMPDITSTLCTIKEETFDCSPSDEELYVSASTAPIAHTNQMQMQFDHTQFNHGEQIFSIDNNNTNTDSSNSNNNNNNINTSTTSFTCGMDKSMTFRQYASDATDNDRMYETTYDDNGNLITVILPDEDISNFEEVIEDLTNEEDDDEHMSHVSVLSPIPSADHASRDSSEHGSDDPATASDHDSAYDSVNSPPGKMSSAWSTTSSVNYMDDDYQCYDYWPQDSFSVLFPSLA